MKRIQVRMGETVKWSASLATLVAVAVAPLLSATSARAAWQKDGIMFMLSTSGSMSNHGATAGNGTLSVFASASSDGLAQGSNGGSASISSIFRQKFLWSGGGTPTTSLKAAGSGNVTGGGGSGGGGSYSCSSSATGPGFVTSGSAPYSSPNPPPGQFTDSWVKHPEGNINATILAGGTTAQIDVTLMAAAGGYGWIPSSSWGSHANADYSIGDIVP